jgi:hypothetical protein
MPEAAVDFSVDRAGAVRVLIEAGLRDDIAERVALAFGEGPSRTPDELNDTIDFVRDIALSLSVVGAMLLLRNGVNPVALAPSVLAEAQALRDFLEDGLAEPAVIFPSHPSLPWW